MRIGMGIVFYLACCLALPAQAQSVGQDGGSPSPAQTLERILDGGQPQSERLPLLRGLVERAQAGDGYSAFALGALYRQGMDHPARLLERDIETARIWLDRCVAADHCPLTALASLAELELAAGNVKQAMQWAQAWVVLERELDRRGRSRRKHGNTKDAPYRHTAYQAYLLDRCYKAMGLSNAKAETTGRAWFDELVKARGAQLDRMLFSSLDDFEGEAGAGEPRLRISAENQRVRQIRPDAPQPLGPAWAFYLYRGKPEGGRAEGVWLVEALPTRRAALGLDTLARNLRMQPYQPSSPDARVYALLPVSYGREGGYSLRPAE